MDEVIKKFSDIKDDIYLFDNVLELNDILKLKIVEGSVDKYKKFLNKIVLFLLKFIFIKVLEDRFCEIFGNLFLYLIYLKEFGYIFRIKDNIFLVDFFFEVK